MKKIFLLLFLTACLAVSAQGTIPAYSTVKLTKTALGTPLDSALVKGANGIVKHLPVSEIKGKTNLDQLATPTGITVFSSTGNDATLPLATTTNAGLQSPADKTKLDGLSNFDPTTINNTLATKVDKVSGKGLSTEDYTTAEKTKLAGVATGATANSTDAQLRDRSTHTGTQAISTVIGLQAAIDAKINLSLINANNGVAPLDAGGKVPFANLPASLMIYKGMWNPAANTPTLADGTGVAGWVYKASVNGAVNLGSGNITFVANDFAIHNGTAWEISKGTDAVVSVNGQQGVVTLTTTHIQEGSNLYYTEARVSANSSVVANTAKVSNATHTGDVSGSTVLTLATVNGNVGTFGNANSIAQPTVNAKGLVTGITNVSIGIAQNQVVNLVGDLGNKAPLNGAGTTGTWPISINGNAASSTLWNGQTYLNTNRTGAVSFMTNNSGSWGYSSISDVQSSLGLGSNAYTSTAYLPLTGGVLTGPLRNDGSYSLYRTSGSVDKALLASSNHLDAGSSTDFNTYVYGNNPYAIWTNGTKRVIVDGTGTSTFTGGIEAGNSGNPTNYIGTVSLGKSGSGYPIIGNNISYTATNNSYTFRATDTSWGLDFGGANSFRLRYANGTGGTSISYTDFITVNNAGVSSFAAEVRALGSYSSFKTIGTDRADLRLQHTNASANAKNMLLSTENGATRFWSLNDAENAAVKDGILSMNHTTGDVSMGYNLSVTGNLAAKYGEFNNTSGGTGLSVRGGDLGSGSNILSLLNNSGTQVARFTGTGKLEGIDASFSSTVTASAHVTSGGNSTQVVRGDGSLSLGYRVYAVTINQSGTGVPTVAWTLENTMLGTVTFSRSGVGEYGVSISTAFPANKGIILVSSGDAAAGFVGAQSDQNGTSFGISTRNMAGVSSDNVLYNSVLEIRIYN